MTSHKCDLLVPQFLQMLQSQQCCLLMIKHDVSHSVQLTMARDRDGRQGWSLRESRIHGDESFHPPLNQKIGVALQGCLVMTMNDSEEKIIALPQKSFDPADYKRTVGITYFFGDDADGVGALLAQGTCEEIGPVLKLASRGVNSCLSTLGNGTGSRRVVQHGGHSSWSKPHTLRDGSQCYRCGFPGSRLIA